MRGRRPKRESRSVEFGQTLVEWKQTPAAFRPSLRTLARELGTSHQLLSYYLATLEEWRQEQDLEEFRAKAKAQNLTLTPAIEKRYLEWRREIEEARGAARAAKWANRHAALLDRLKHLLPDFSMVFRSVNRVKNNLPVFVRGFRPRKANPFRTVIRRAREGWQLR